MKKLVKGIIDFRKHVRPSYRETFARLALGQSPDTLFIACSDSRVAPNVFASTDPGDLFVIRNVGNLVPPCGGEHGRSTADESEAAAIEFAVMNLGVSDVIICGHSECGAMQALLNGREKVQTPNLKSWGSFSRCTTAAPTSPFKSKTRSGIILRLRPLRLKSQEILNSPRRLAMVCRFASTILPPPELRPTTVWPWR